MGARKVGEFIERKNADEKKEEVKHWALRKTNVWGIAGERELTEDPGR